MKTTLFFFFFKRKETITYHSKPNCINFSLTLKAWPESPTVLIERHKLYIVNRNAGFTCLTPAKQRTCISQNPETEESCQIKKYFELSSLPIA